jgi:hypothetical protein
VGGVFYIIGAVVVAVLVGSLSSLSSSSYGDLFGTDTSTIESGLSAGSLDGISNDILVIGVIVGLVMVFGGVLFNSESATRRKAGGILVVLMIIIGGIPTLGGLLIGFILAVIGAYLGITYKSNMRGITIGLGPVGSIALGSQAGFQPTGPAGMGPLNYCIKCGSPIRSGAVFCGACGARVVD